MKIRGQGAPPSSQLSKAAVLGLARQRQGRSTMARRPGTQTHIQLDLLDVKTMADQGRNLSSMVMA